MEDPPCWNGSSTQGWGCPRLRVNPGPVQLPLKPRVPPLPTAGRPQSWFPATPPESVSTPDHLSHSVFTQVLALVQCSSAETHSRVSRQEVLVGTSPEERQSSPFWLVCRKTTECPPGALLGNDQISILLTLKPETQLSKLPGGLDTIRPLLFNTWTAVSGWNTGTRGPLSASSLP